MYRPMVNNVEIYTRGIRIDKIYDLYLTYNITTDLHINNPFSEYLITCNNICIGIIFFGDCLKTICI